MLYKRETSYQYKTRLNKQKLNGEKLNGVTRRQLIKVKRSEKGERHNDDIKVLNYGSVSVIRIQVGK